MTEQKKKSYKWWIIGGLGCLLVLCIVIAIISAAVYLMVISPKMISQELLTKAEKKLTAVHKQAESITKNSADFEKNPTKAEFESLESKTSSDVKAALDNIEKIDNDNEHIRNLKDLSRDTKTKDKADLIKTAANKYKEGLDTYKAWLEDAVLAFDFFKKIEEAASAEKDANKQYDACVALINKYKNVVDKSNDAALQKESKIFSKTKNQYKQVNKLMDTALSVKNDIESLTIDSSDMQVLRRSANARIKLIDLLEKSAKAKNLSSYNKLTVESNALLSAKKALFSTNLKIATKPGEWITSNIIVDKFKSIPSQFSNAAESKDTALEFD